MALSKQAVLKRADNTTYEVVADEAILIHLDTGTYYSLNKVGTEFWESLDGEKSIADQAEVIAVSYSVDTEMVMTDLLEIASEMLANGLVIAV